MHGTEPSGGGRFALRLALFYAALFFAVGIQLPFLPLWLNAKGLGATLIGVILAMPMVVRLVAIPFAAHHADRLDALRSAILAAAAASAAAYFVVGLMDGPLSIVAACAVAALFYAPLNSLTDAFALSGLRVYGRTYGPVRLWGSVAFTVGMLGAGVIIDLIATKHLIWLIAGGSLITALAAIGLPALPPAGHVDAPDDEISRHLLRNAAFLSAVAANALTQASHAVYYGFSTLHWIAAGFDGKIVAVLWSIGVVAEIVLFAMQARLPAWMTPLNLLVIGSAGALLRWTVMAFGPPDALLPLLQCLHALSFGCAHLGALSYVTQVAPIGHAARAQGYHSIAMGLAMAGAMTLAGLLYARYGGGAYAGMAVLAVAGSACAIAAKRFDRRIADRARAVDVA